MEEILRDSEKDQNNFTALQEGSSDASSQAAGEGGSAGAQTNQPSLHLVLDPSATGSASPLSHIWRFFSLCTFKLTLK